MSTERDELAEALSGAYEVFYEPLDWHETTRIAAALLAAGYSKPRTPRDGPPLPGGDRVSLDEIRQRVEGATPVPWDRFDAQIRHTQIDGWIDPEGRRKAQEQTERDIQFVSHARTDIPRLLAAVDAALALAEAYKVRAAKATVDDWEGCIVLADASVDIRAAVTDALGGDQ